MTRHFAQRLGTGGSGLDYALGIVDYNRLRTERLARSQATMKKNNMAVALLMRPENIRYVSSTKGVDFIERLRYCLAFAEYEPIVFDNWYKALGGEWIKPENRGVAIHIGQQSPGPEASWESAKRFAAQIKEELRKKGLEKEKLGIDDIDEVAREALIEEGIQIENAMPVLLEARAVKTQDEINLFHMSAVIADIAHYEVYRAIKPGIREREIRGIAVEALYRAGAEDVLEVSVNSGGRIGVNAVSRNSDRIIQPGDIVTMDISRGIYMGYYSCYYRNYMVGRKPTDAEKDLYKRAYERMNRVIDAIKPGVTTAEVAQQWLTAKEKGLPSEDYTWCDEMAHGIGLFLYEYPICNRLWSIKHPQTYQKGNTVAVEALENDPNVGYVKIEEMIAVTDTGTEIFSRMPSEGFMRVSPIIVE